MLLVWDWCNQFSRDTSGSTHSTERLQRRRSGRVLGTEIVSTRVPEAVCVRVCVNRHHCSHLSSPFNVLTVQYEDAQKKQTFLIFCSSWAKLSAQTRKASRHNCYLLNITYIPYWYCAKYFRWGSISPETDFAEEETEAHWN